jgi:hypothetical protein
MKPCYYCGDKSVGVANDVPVCKHHQPEDKPTERKVQAADPVGPDWPYGVYDTANQSIRVTTPSFKPLTKAQIIAEFHRLGLIE